MRDWLYQKYKELVCKHKFKWLDTVTYYHDHEPRHQLIIKCIKCNKYDHINTESRW